MDSEKVLYATNETMLIDKEKFALLGRLSGGLLHNLGTPLMSSSGQLMLSDSKLENLLNIINKINDHKNELQPIINDIIEHNQNLRNYLYYMSDIINCVKSYIKNSSSQQQPLTLSDIFNKVCILTAFESKSKYVKINFEINDELKDKIIEGESNCIIQVLVNMVDNAIHSYKGQRGIIDIVANPKKLDKINYLLISVKDNGSGMDDIIKSKLLNQMVTTKGNTGTGIGLYLSNMLINDKFKGFIKFQSELNVGTTMYIYIPQ